MTSKIDIAVLKTQLRYAERALADADDSLGDLTMQNTHFNWHHDELLDLITEFKVCVARLTGARGVGKTSAARFSVEVAMRKVYIMRGIPGAGKSTFLAGCRTNAIVSADHYFDGENGYRFDPSKLADAHQACFRNFLVFLQEGIDSNDPDFLIAVDNTNISAIEIAPYYLAAESHGYDVEIVNIDCPLDRAIARNIHGVPREVIMRMYQRMLDERKNLPVWWNQSYI